MRFATVVELEETATGVPVRRAEVAWQMTALEARALGALGWGGSLVLRPESTLLRALDGLSTVRGHASPKRSFHDSVTPQMISDVGWAIAISSTTFTASRVATGREAACG